MYKMSASLDIYVNNNEEATIELFETEEPLSIYQDRKNKEEAEPADILTSLPAICDKPHSLFCIS